VILQSQPFFVESEVINGTNVPIVSFPKSNNNGAVTAVLRTDISHSSKVSFQKILSPNFVIIRRESGIPPHINLRQSPVVMQMDSNEGGHGQEREEETY